MITEAERLARYEGLGSSDAGAVLGLSPWKTAGDLYWEKVLREDTFKGNASTDAGNRFEGAILDWAEDHLGKLERDVSVVHREHPWLRANLDGRLNAKEGVEAKFINAGDFSKWGREGTDEVPYHYLVQCLHQMLVCDFDRVYLVALIPFRLVVQFQIERADHEENLELLFAAERKFWFDHVLAKVPPPNSPPPLAHLLKQERTKSLVEWPDSDILPEYAGLKVVEKETRVRLDILKRQIIERLGEASRAKDSSGYKASVGKNGALRVSAPNSEGEEG